MFSLHNISVLEQNLCDQADFKQGQGWMFTQRNFGPTPAPL